MDEETRKEDYSVGKSESYHKEYLLRQLLISRQLMSDIERTYIAHDEKV